MHNIFVVFLICTGQYALAIRIQNLPCFTDESLKDLEEARKELTTVDNYIEKTVKILADEFQKTLNSMKSQLVTMQTNVSKIVQKVDTDLILMSKDLEELDGYWIGLTDLIEGEWRWSEDQSLASFKNFVHEQIWSDVREKRFLFLIRDEFK
ncbi:Hypothetical predicted protein [Mytilus galloprovincialis]|uniref:Uncharacterized protein n=1 Tax=Mytilus galloprovincialis TaxID=29158 RepID=A0A8B6CC72_MYTGA|nr:Hypothetical predicted protein [Mytilus galloprovincialis]